MAERSVDYHARRVGRELILLESLAHMAEAALAAAEDLAMVPEPAEVSEDHLYQTDWAPGAEEGEPSGQGDETASLLREVSQKLDALLEAARESRDVLIVETLEEIQGRRNRRLGLAGC